MPFPPAARTFVIVHPNKSPHVSNVAVDPHEALAMVGTSVAVRTGPAYCTVIAAFSFPSPCVARYQSITHGVHEWPR